MAATTSLRKPCLHAAQPFQLHHDVITRLQPFRLYQTARQHDLTGMQTPPCGREMVVKPCQRVRGMADHVGALPVADLDAVEDGAPLHLDVAARTGSEHLLAKQ